ncbi:MAG: thioredoxin [Bacilli bacterium]
MIKHISNNEEFTKEVKESKELILVDFYAEWCGPCKMLAPNLEQIQNEIKIAKVNVDELREPAVEFGVMSIPSLFLMKDGKILNQSLGYMDLSQLKEFIKKGE